MLVARNAREAHAAVVDWETPVHFGVGCSAGIMGISATAAVLIAIGGEVALRSQDRGLHAALFDKSIPASSLANHAADVIAVVLGVRVGSWLAKRA